MVKSPKQSGGGSWVLPVLAFFAGLLVIALQIGGSFAYVVWKAKELDLDRRAHVIRPPEIEGGKKDPHNDPEPKKDPEVPIETPKQGEKDPSQVPVPNGVPVGAPATPLDGKLAGRDIALYRRQPLEHDQEVSSGAFSPDGTVLATGHKAGVSLWDIAQGKRIGFLPIEAKNEWRFNGPGAVAFSADGALLAAGDNSKIYLWTVRDGKTQRVIADPMGGINAEIVDVHFLGGDELLAGYADGALRVWSVKSGALVRTLPEKSMRTLFREADVRVSHDGKAVAFVADSDKKLVHMEIASGKVLQRWSAHPGDGKTMLVFSPNGTHLISTGQDSRLMQWELAAPKEGKLLTKLPENSEALALSPSGQLLAATSSFGVIEIYDSAEGKRLGGSSQMPSSFVSYKRLCFSPTGRQVAAIGPKNKVQIWDLELSSHERALSLAKDNEFLGSIAGAADGSLAVYFKNEFLVLDSATGTTKHQLPLENIIGINGLALDMTAKRLAVGGQVAQVFDLASKAKRDSFPIGDRGVLVFSPDDKLLAGTRSNTVLLDADQKTTSLHGHRNQVRALKFSFDGRWLASAGDDGKIIVWDPVSKKKKWEFDAHERTVRHLAFSGNGLWLASAGENDDPTIRIWDLTLGKEKTTLQARYSGLHAVMGLLMSPDGNHVVVSHNANDLHLWDVAANKLTRYLPGHKDLVGPLEALGANRFASSDGKRILIWSWDKVVTMPIDFRDSVDRPTIEAPPAFLTMQRETPLSNGPQRVRYSRDGTLLALLGNKEVTVVKMADGNPLPWKMQQDDVRDLAFSHDGKTVATTGKDKDIKIWNVESGQLLKTLTGHTANANALAFALDGKVLVSGSGVVVGDYELIFWDMPAGTIRHKTKEKTANIISLATAPDGKSVASGSTNGKVFLWNPDNGNLIKTFDVEVNSQVLAFSPDGKRLAAGDANLNGKSKLFIWDVAAGNLLHKIPYIDSDSFNHLAFSADGNMLLAHIGRSAYVYDVKQGKPSMALNHLHEVNNEIFGKVSTLNMAALTPDGKTLATWSYQDNKLKLWNATELGNAALQQGMGGFLAAGGQGQLDAGMLHLTLAVRGRLSAAAFDRIGAMPYPVALKLIASENLNDNDLARLKGAANLRRLDLGGATFLAEDGLRHLAALPKLESLKLNSPHVNDDNIMVLRTLASLQVLELEDTDVTATGIAALKKALPKLQVKMR